MLKVSEALTVLAPILKTKKYRENLQMQEIVAQIKTLTLEAVGLIDMGNLECPELIQCTKDIFIPDEAEKLLRNFLKKFGSLTYSVGNLDYMAFMRYSVGI